MRRRKTWLVWGLLTSLLSIPGTLLARLAAPEGMEDIPRLASHATFIFHADLLGIESVPGPESVSGGSVYEVQIASLAVDRWYVGRLSVGRPRPETVRLKYVYPGGVNGSDCIDLNRSSSWLIFAKLRPDGLYGFRMIVKAACRCQRF
jgi:hypothetical protein